MVFVFAMESAAIVRAIRSFIVKIVVAIVIATKAVAIMVAEFIDYYYCYFARTPKEAA